MVRNLILLVAAALIALRLPAAETPDSVQATVADEYRFKPKQLIAPAVLVGLGTTGFFLNPVKDLNHDIADHFGKHGRGLSILDEGCILAPMASIYVLDLCKVRARHTMAQQTVLLGTASIVNIVVSYSSKFLIHSERPDGSNTHSFPSNHTAFAFMGAELLRREYWQTLPWIGVAGYAFAATTGFLRIYQNRHWLTDVVAGAGVGILSVEAAYWLYPFVTKTFFPKLYRESLVVAPFASPAGGGVSLSMTF